MDTKQQERDRGNGQYKFTAEAVCKCGHGLGVHSAERVNGNQPCFNGDVGDGVVCDCECFKKAKVVK